MWLIICQLTYMGLLFLHALLGQTVLPTLKPIIVLQITESIHQSLTKPRWPTNLLWLSPTMKMFTNLWICMYLFLRGGVVMWTMPFKLWPQVARKVSQITFQTKLWDQAYIELPWERWKIAHLLWRYSARSPPLQYWRKTKQTQWWKLEQCKQ